MAETPVELITVISTKPGEKLAGNVHVSVDDDRITTDIQLAFPSDTVIFSENPSPEIVTSVPPFKGPNEGETLLINKFVDVFEQLKVQSINIEMASVTSDGLVFFRKSIGL